jgi:hypothetical protein
MILQNIKTNQKEGLVRIKDLVSEVGERSD